MKFINNIINSFILRFSKKRKRRGIYYVNGPDTLPPPLSPEKELEILEKIETDENARPTLVEHNLRLVVYIAKRFENTSVGIEDLVSIGTLGLIKAVNTFRADKNIKLATYASRCIENEILMYIRKRGNIRNEILIDEPLNIDWDGNELLLSDVLGNEEDGVSYELERREERDVIRRALDTLSEREREIISLRYGFGSERELTQKEVADKLGISQSYISRLEKKIISKLRTELELKL